MTGATWPWERVFRVLLSADGQRPSWLDGTFAFQPGVQEHRKSLNRDLLLRSRHGHELGRRQSNRRKSWASATTRAFIVRGIRDAPSVGQSHRRRPQEHPFSNGEVFEKLGMPAVSGKLDSESFVDVTTSRPPCRAMIDV
jgi:hypothetical protein